MASRPAASIACFALARFTKFSAPSSGPIVARSVWRRRTYVAVSATVRSGVCFDARRRDIFAAIPPSGGGDRVLDSAYWIGRPSSK
jgi:hypothetical protein